MTSVGFLVDRIRLGLERDATQLLGADLVLSSDTPIAPTDEQARAARAADRTNGDISQHGDQCARRRSHVVVSRQSGFAGYPLRGTLRVADLWTSTTKSTREIPARGEVWVDGQLLQALGLAPGDSLKLGEKTFRIAQDRCDRAGSWHAVH